MVYFKNTTWVLVEQILRILASLLVGIWVARYLGPAQYGLFSYAIAFVAIFSGIAKLGLDSIVVKYLVSEPKKTDYFIGTAFWLKIFGALIAWTLIGIATYLSKNDKLTNLYIVIIASGVIFQSFEVIEFYFQSKVLSKYVSICKIIQLIISSIVKIYLVSIKAELILFVLVSVIDQLVLSMALVIAYKNISHNSFYKKMSFSVVNKMLKDSWPLMLSTISILVYMRIDQIMIKNMIGARELGIFTAAVTVVSCFYFVPSLISNSVFPSIIRARNSDTTIYYRRLQLLITTLCWLSILIYLPIAIFSDFIIETLFGNDFIEAGKVLKVYCFAGFFVFLGVSSSNWFINEGLQKNMMYRTLFGALLNIVMNLILIPKYGIVGAAFSTLASQFFVSFCLDFCSRTTRSIFYMKVYALLMHKSITKHNFN